MSSVKGDDDALPDHLMALLGAALDAFRVDMASARTPAPLAGLRSSQLRVLSLTPRQGMRLTDLAARVGMTKQALGEFADELEGRGLLESVRDEQDRRVRLLRLTPRGRRAVAAGERVIAAVEARWRSRLGESDYRRLRELLVQAAEPRTPEPSRARSTASEKARRT